MKKKFDSEAVNEDFPNPNSAFFWGSLFGEERASSSLSDEELRIMLFGKDYQMEGDTFDQPRMTWIPSYSGEMGGSCLDNPLYGPYLGEEATFLESSIEAFYL